jgi:hypothetical protein
MLPIPISERQVHIVEMKKWVSKTDSNNATQMHFGSCTIFLHSKNNLQRKMQTDDAFCLAGGREGKSRSPLFSRLILLQPPRAARCRHGRRWSTRSSFPAGAGTTRRVRGGAAAASCASSERALTGELRTMEDWRSRERRGGGAVDEEGAEPREGGSGSADTRPRRRATGTASSQASGHLQRRRLRCDLARQRRRGRGGSVLRVGCWRWKIF